MRTNNLIEKMIKYIFKSVPKSLFEPIIRKFVKNEILCKKKQ